MPLLASRTNEPADALARPGLLAMERMERVAGRRRRWRVLLVLLTPLAGVLVGVGTVLERPTVYSAVAQLRLVPNVLYADRPLPLDAMALADEAEMLVSGGFLRSVAGGMPRELQARVLPGVEAEGVDETTRERALAEMLGASMVVQQNKTNNLFELDYFDEDPRLARDVLQEVVDAAAGPGVWRSKQRAARTEEFFRGQLQLLEERIAAARARENATERGAEGLAAREAQRRAGAEYEFELGTVGPDAELVTLEQAESEAKLRARVLEGRVLVLEALPEKDVEALEENPVLRAVRGDLDAAQAEYDALRVTLGPEEPGMRARAAEMQSYRERLSRAGLLRLRAARAEAEAARRTAGVLAAETNRRRAALQTASPAEVEDAMLEIDLALNLGMYQEIRQRLLEARLRTGLGPAVVLVVQSPEIPPKPVVRGFRVPMVIGLFAGLGLGMLGALVLAKNGLVLWTVAAMEGSTGLPVLSLVPEVAMRRPPALAAGVEEALQVLVEELRLLPAAVRRETLLFTSAMPGEGKTTTAAGYAVVLARGGRRRVLLVDCDLHRPTVHRYFGLANRVGLSTVLEGRATLEAALQGVDGVPGLHVLPAGPVSPSPSELLGAAGLRELLAGAAERYEFVLIDSPPVLALMDAVTLAQMTGSVLLVARYGRTTLAQTTRAGELLGRAGVPMAGVIVNGAPGESRG